MILVKKIQKLLFYLLILGGILSCNKNEYLPERISRTNLISVATNKEYKLYISLPKNYSKNKEYNVIYHLDGDSDYKKISRSANKVIEENQLESQIIVGVGYGKNENESENDYLLTSTEGTPDGGGALKFYNFFVKELIPFIGKEYGGRPTNNTLVGKYFGGQFTILSFFLSNKEYQEIDKFVIISPAINYDDGLAFSWESYFNTQWTNYNASIAIVMGGNEESDRLMMGKAFIKKLNSRGYPDLKTNWELIKNSSKEHILESATESGLKFVLNN